MNNLTTIAALPQGGGCMAALSPEKNEQPVKVQMPCFDELALPPIDPEEFGRMYLAACLGTDA